MDKNVNKVEVNGQTIVDLTADTVDAEHLAEGYTAHGKDGAPITGTMKTTAVGVQTDWDETDISSPAYLKNRPFGYRTDIIEWDGENRVGRVEMPYNGSTVDFYRISDLAPMVDDIDIITIDITADPDAELDPAFSLQIQYSEDEKVAYLYWKLIDAVPAMIIYEGSELLERPGIYCVDLQSASAIMQMPIAKVGLGVNWKKKLDAEHLPKLEPEWDDVKNKPLGKERFYAPYNGGTTGESFEVQYNSLQIPFYFVTGEHPEIVEDPVITIFSSENISAKLDVRPVENGMRELYSADFGSAPAMILYDDNAFGATPGLYIVDFTVASMLIGMEIYGVDISWTQEKKIDPVYLPFKVTRYFAKLEDLERGALDRSIDETSDMIVVNINFPAMGEWRVVLTVKKTPKNGKTTYESITPSGVVRASGAEMWIEPM